MFESDRPILDWSMICLCDTMEHINYDFWFCIKSCITARYIIVSNLFIVNNITKLLRATLITSVVAHGLYPLHLSRNNSRSVGVCYCGKCILRIICRSLLNIKCGNWIRKMRIIYQPSPHTCPFPYPWPLVEY